jgi:hypothetical protein
MSEQTEDQSPIGAPQAEDGTTLAVATTGAPVLSEDEKARIRHEMFLREEIRRELTNAKSPERRYGVHPFLNSPFFLTAVCGLLASMISHFHSRATAENERRLAQENAIREKQIALLSSVANDVPTYVSTMGSMKKLKLWLKEHPDSDEKLEGRPRDEVDKDYKEYFKLYLQARKARSILAEVRSYYESPVVLGGAGPGDLGLVDKEERAVEDISNAKKSEDVVGLANSQDEHLDALLRAMAREIRSPHRHD